MRKDNNRYTRAVDAVDAVDATSLPPVPVRTEVVLVVLGAEMRN